MRKTSLTISITTVTILLVIIGLLFVYSASNVIALDRYGTPYYFFIRQLIFAGIGLCLMSIASRLDYTLLKDFATPIFIVCLLLLVAVAIPGVGVVRGGARSWLGIGSFGVQPSEFMKIGMMILLAKFIAKSYGEIERLPNLMAIGIVVLVVFGLIMLQPDFGTGMVIVLASVVLLFISGLPLKYFAVLLAGGLIGITGLIISAPYRLRRIFAFLNPWSDPLGAGFQIIQSLYAIAPGGLFGVGFNRSVQKYFYLPEPQTDFIFAIILEEMGFIGGMAILSLYLYFLYLCLKVSFLQEDLFAKFLSLGLTSLIFIQFFINIAVVIGIIPVTGVTLPFLSYGGSSLMVTLVSVGIILNISRHIME